jgi:hypothetical protein
MTWVDGYVERTQEGGVYARQASIALENNAFRRRRFVKCAEPVSRSLKSRRELEAIDQKLPDWTAGKKNDSQSAQQAARGNKERSGSRSCSGPVNNTIELRNQASVPSPAAARFSIVRALLVSAGSQLSGIRFVVLTSAARWSLTRTIVR